MVWRNTILSKLLFYIKPHPPSILWHHINLKSIEIVSFHRDTKSSGMDTVLNKHTTSIFRQPPEDASSIFLWNNAPHTTCYAETMLCLFTTLKTWSKELWCGWFMLGKLNDKYRIIFFSNTVFNAAMLCTTYVLQFLLIPKMKQERKVI